jgi:putative aldouronate transport system permease protein
MFLLCVYPLYFVVIASFSSPVEVSNGRVIILPKTVTLEGYMEVFSYIPLWRGYVNTIAYTIIGTSVNVILTICAGYALSRADLPGRQILTFIFTFTMIFQGGLVPRYLLVRDLGLLNTTWSMVLPSAVNVFYLIMCRTFFATTIPGELLDSARMDGSSNIGFFFRIVLPISPALIAIMVLYYAVFHWNSFFDAFLFLTDRKRHPIQLVLRDLIIQNESALIDTDPVAADERQRLAELIKFGAIIFSSLPILLFYPFLQKYFVRGVMIGALKG